MNPRYKNGILLFGAFVPLLLLAVGFGFLASKNKNVKVEADKRQSVYRNNIRAEKTAEGVKVQLKAYEEKEKHWTRLLKNSDVGSVTSLLKEISTMHSSGEKFRQNDFNFVNRETGIGAASRQPSVTYNISLSGTFEALQDSLLQLESQMPNLNLNSLEMKPQSSGTL